MSTVFRHALISVSDKTGITDFADRLTQRGVKLISTGGTAKELKKAGLRVTAVQDVTGFKEILDGRVKTLHPNIHAGLLARRDHLEDIQTLNELGIAAIDLLIVNLYPFLKVCGTDASFETKLENIDVGGPAMLRAAAKNHASVLSVVDPDDYEKVLQVIDSKEPSMDFRRFLAAKTFAHTARYDAAIAGFMEEAAGLEKGLRIFGSEPRTLRYGENPHQRAVLFAQEGPPSGIACAKKIQGKEVSYNNLRDADAAWKLVCEFDKPAAVIVKHTNPCGAATANSLEEAYQTALSTDRQSAFGGIVALNGTVQKRLAEQLTSIFTELVIASGCDDEALDVLRHKRDLRVLIVGQETGEPKQNIVSVAGGYLLQDTDYKKIGASDLKIVTEKQPDEEEIHSCLFAEKCVKHLRSNAIAIASGETLLGAGAGQTSRVEAVELAIAKARKLKPEGKLVLASDAFFPFPDSVERAARAGISTIIQPGGSKNDQQIIDTCDEYGIAMIFTDTRRFYH